MNKTYLGLVNTFFSPALIIFNITRKVDKKDKEYTINVPVPGSQKIEYDKAILVFSLNMIELGMVFATIKSPSCILFVRIS